MHSGVSKIGVKTTPVYLFFYPLILLPLYQSSNLRWLLLGLAALGALSVVVSTEHRYYGNRVIWGCLGLMTLIAIINGSTVSNIILLPLYGLIMLGALQLRNNRGFTIFTLLVLAEVVSTIVMSFQRSESGNGGLIDSANYNLAAGLILIGFLLSSDKYKWIIFPLVVIGAFLTSGEEALVLLGTLIIVIIIRQDWSKKVMPSLLIALVCIVLLLCFHQPERLYVAITDQVNVVKGQATTHDLVRGRYEGYELAITTPTVLGHEFNVEWDTNTIHDVPLRVMYDLGILGLLAFLVILVVWVKDAPIYVGASVVAMMLFDHYLWTQIGAWLWVLFGLYYKAPGTCIFKQTS